MNVLDNTALGPQAPGYWADGELPANTRLGWNSVITAPHAFKRFRSTAACGLTMGNHCTMDGVHFSVGPAGSIEIGDYCYFTNALLLCEQRVQIGHYVVIGWNVTIADSDFHPLAPAARVLDAIACSPLSGGRTRPENILCQPVIIEDDVWIGPNTTILKGVCVGRGAFIEPGSMVTRSVEARARVMGNPAQVVGTV